MQRLFSIPIVALALVALPLVGCATADSEQVTARDYAKPRETIRAAQEIGANQVPKAKMYLSYAKDEVNKADKLLDEGENYQARMALARAQADADLALTMAKERRMVKQVRQIEHRIQRLENQVIQE